MKRNLFLSMLVCLTFLHFSGFAQEKPAITWKDIPSWEYIRTMNTSLSPDGKWLSWTSGPTKGDLVLTLRHTRDTLKYEFPIGASSSTALFSDDNRYVAFRVSPTDKEEEAAKKSKKPLYTKLQIVSLADTQKVSFERIRSFAFSGKQAGWLAVGFVPAEGAPKGENIGKGTDLVLYNLSSKTSYNLGNVSEFAFNKAGNTLAYIIDANGQNGNGILIRDMATGITTVLDNDKASYSRIRWNDEGTAFALLKANKNEAYKSEVYSVVGISKINGSQTAKVIYSGIDDEGFPKGMGISANGMAYWSDDLGTLFFGIAKLEKKEEKKAPETSKTESAKSDGTKPDSTALAGNRRPGGPAAGPGQRPGGAGGPGAAADIEKPDMIIWNWQDKRLQSAQQLQEMRDKNFSFSSAYHIALKKFVQLADSNIRNVSINPKQQFALGYDVTPYELDNNLSGQSYTDVYLIDVRTGEKSILLENLYQNASRGLSVSPNGQFLVYYKGGAFYSINLLSKTHHPLTERIQASFVDAMDDHNVEKPATPVMGWSDDSKSVLIRDNYDLWKIDADGKKAVSLSPNWKRNKIQVNGAFRIYPDDKGIDFKKTQYFNLFNDANKQAGVAILEAGKDQLRVLFMDGNSYSGFRKAEQSGSFVYTKANSVKSPELFVTHAADLSGATQLSENTKGQDKYAWSPGVRLIEYISAHGDTLQAALYLPAGYEEGKSYPTITYIYERLTQDLNGYAQPGFPGGGFNRAVYTSNGYAVLMPDIKYQLNDPGMSAVACVVPAVKAAIATGIVDSDNVAIHGHSWGGYQTSFLITQTNIFKAAAAGAPLTNMISMYSLIYWNSGSTNQSIFESSQGRLTTGYWDNWEAYKRNSPIYHIKNVQTPLLLLHNDKDGAVDYTQGIEYYNGLRRLNKPVTMITYKGENHGIVKEANRKDYAVRMLEFMDHYLKGKPAPDWWAKGIDHIDMKKHLEERAF